jgi:hypothetical protein
MVRPRCNWLCDDDSRAAYKSISTMDRVDRYEPFRVKGGIAAQNYPCCGPMLVHRARCRSGEPGCASR